MKVALARSPVLILCAAIAACQPPAADNYSEHTPARETRSSGPSVPMDSPDAQGAVWAETGNAERILYGKPGERPLFALECLASADEPLLQFTRYAPADEGAKAFMALIGNGHVARLKVDAVEVGPASLWQGTTPLSNDRLEVFTGRNAVEATVPGAGTLRLNASNAPAQLINSCRARSKALETDAEPDPPANPE